MRSGRIGNERREGEKGGRGEGKKREGERKCFDAVGLLALG